ncbi:hypothetical protein MPOCJGCO_0893 [Methylobacterium trifolii]|uniref:Uncharacterized protein n=1 Tax=Methylobacterium trifolii TaxID=1003092 RepID=A0ABQ4TV56_9HYPH|nr:hypothetical protein MPOCJGCO_0893 [Methylobacterium trifolii]
MTTLQLLSLAMLPLGGIVLGAFAVWLNRSEKPTRG